MKRAAVAFFVCCCTASFHSAQAETLYDAFCSAFAGNEVLGSQRAAVRISAQDKAVAQTGYMPSVDGNANYGYDDLKGRTPETDTTDSKTHPRGYGVSLSQNLFNGFRTTSTVAREDASLQSEQDKLGDVEQRILIDVATAYVDVIRDKAVLELHQRDRELLQAREKQAVFRFQIGELTRTDVDQSEASLARSRADLIIAETNLDASKAVFQSVVGRDPGKLEPAAVPERLLPGDLDSALAIADAEHPAIRSAFNAARAAEANIDVERSGYAPSIDVTASSTRRWDPEFYQAQTHLVENKVIGRLTIPLYDRGLTFASVRRASALSSQRQLQLDHQRIEVRTSVIQNRNTFLASKAIIASADAQIAASVRALDGVEQEATAGQRTTLDVLTAQRSLLDARVDREIAQHDRIVAGYRFLASVGRLSLSRMRTEDTRGRVTRSTVFWQPPERLPLARFMTGLAKAPPREEPTALHLAFGQLEFSPFTAPRIGRFPDGWHRKIGTAVDVDGSVASASRLFGRMAFAEDGDTTIGRTADARPSSPERANGLPIVAVPETPQVGLGLRPSL